MKFAKLGLNNIVLDIVSIRAIDSMEPVSGSFSEEIGIKYLKGLTGHEVWRRTYDDGTRKNDASVGYTYDSTRDAFIPPQLYNSWTLNETTCQWEPPVEQPNSMSIWNEETQTWSD